MSYITIVLVSVLIIAALTDLQQRRIPNLLTFPAMLFGILAHLHASGLAGLWFSTGGLALGIGFLLLFYLSGMMGAGDVKLMGAVGSMIGPQEVFQAFLYTAFAGGIYALIVLAWKGLLINFVKRIFHSLHLSLINRRLTLIPEEGHASPILCYGIAIGVGTVISIFFDLPGF